MYLQIQKCANCFGPCHVESRRVFIHRDVMFVCCVHRIVLIDALFREIPAHYQRANHEADVWSDLPACR